MSKAEMTVNMFLYDAQKELASAIRCMDAIRIDVVLEKQPYVLLDICNIYLTLTENHSNEMVNFILEHKKTAWFFDRFPLSKVSLLSLVISQEDVETLKLLLRTATISYQDYHFTISYEKNNTVPLMIHFDDIPESSRINIYVYYGICREFGVTVENIEGRAIPGSLVKNLMLEYRDIVRDRDGSKELER